MNNKVLTKEEFIEFAKPFSVSNFNYDYLYDTYLLATQGIKNLTNEVKTLNLEAFNTNEVILYLLGEYSYLISGLTKEELDKFHKDTKTQENISSTVADTSLTLSLFPYQEKKITNKFIPPISFLNIYSNMMLKILENRTKNDPKSTLIIDLMNKSLTIIRCILNLLVNGYETSSLATWRTLHECECSLIVLNKYQKHAIDAYLKHMEYGLCFHRCIENIEYSDKVFATLKDEMKSYDLKSKDIKKFIEYGWLLKIDEFKNNHLYKLNFRDGLEAFAGLSEYSENYQLSSEILHSTPLLIYSDKECFHLLTLVLTYESFFRLEEIFNQIFETLVDGYSFQMYQMMREIYLQKLLKVHENEKSKFEKYNVNNTSRYKGM